MNRVIEELAPFESNDGLVNVVIETPKGSRVKYAYDHQSGCTGLKQRLPKGMMFPFNFGFVPGTKAEDGDPLDILLLNDEPLFPGCLVKASLVGVIKAEQTEKSGKKVRNDRLVGLALGEESTHLEPGFDLDERALAEIEYFFFSYNQPAGKRFRVVGKGGKRNALARVRRCALDIRFEGNPMPDSEPANQNRYPKK